MINKISLPGFPQLLMVEKLPLTHQRIEEHYFRLLLLIELIRKQQHKLMAPHL